MKPEEFRDAARRVAEWVARYREEVERYPVLARAGPGEVAGRVPEEPPEEGEGFEEILADVDRVVLPGITHWNHPGFFAYFSSTSSAPGLLAEFIAAALNQNAMLWRTSPAATELEERMVDWLRRALGLPGAFRGVIQDTASTSSFVSLVAAREALGRDVRERGLAGRDDLPPLTVYVSDEAHSSLVKAAIAGGIGRDNVRRIATDDRFRMRPEALRRALREDEEAGRLPVFVGATIGTTSTASADPVRAVSRICREHGAWLHVDAAYAGPAAMLPEMRPRFSGWEEADSIVVNPHKWMATPVDCSVLLFRDPAVFRRSLALAPAYLRSDAEGATNLMDYGLALGRRFRALKLWFLFRWYGLEGLRGMLRRHIRWAEGFADRIRESPRFALAAPPSFSTVCFRSVPPPEGAGAEPERRPPAARRKGRDPTGREETPADAWNRELLAAVNREGTVFLSGTELEGRFTLRLSVGSPFTDAERVRRVVELLEESWERLAGAAP